MSYPINIMKRFFSILATLLFMTSAAMAQEQIPVEEMSFEIPHLSPDAKVLGMGGLSMTARSASHALYNNAATAAFSHTPFLISSSYYRQGKTDAYAVTGAFCFGNGNALQAGWRQYLYVGDSKDTSIDLGYSRRIGQQFAIGVVGRYMHQKREEVKVNALAVDLSAAYEVPIRNLGSYSTLRTGLKVSNIGGYLSDVDYALPLNVTAGVALDMHLTDEHEITVGTDMGYYCRPQSVRGYHMSVGAEYNLMQLIQIRGGYHYGEKEEAYCPSYATVGAGLRFLHIRVDFAYVFAKKDNPFRDTYSLSFGLDF